MLYFWIILCIVIYLISIRVSYKKLQSWYKPGGKFERSNPTFVDIIFCVVPVINTIFMISEVCSDHDTSKFFNIKK